MTSQNRQGAAVAQTNQKQPESRANTGLDGVVQACPEGGDQIGTKSTAGGMDDGSGVVPKAIIDAIDNLIDCAQSDGMFEMDPDGDGSAPGDTAPARAALLALLQNQQQNIPEIIQGAAKTQNDDRSDWCRLSGCSHKNAGSPVWETEHGTDKADAARYRWLRDNSGVDNDLEVEVFIEGQLRMPGHLCDQVDEAMQQESPQ